jgi:hypothetical protein
MIRASLFRNAIAVVIASACASNTQRAYVAPTPDTVFTTAEEMTATPGQLIYAENRSSVPVTVYSFTLRECQNVKQQCAVRAMNLHIDPGSRAQLGRVEPSNPQNAFGFRYSFAWRTDSSTTAALGALAQTGDASAQQRLDAMRRAEARRRTEVGAQDLDLTAAELTAFGDKAALLRPVPDSVVLNVGARVSLDTVRVLLIGTSAELLGRVRTLQWRVSSSGAITLVQPDTLVARAPGRTVLQLKLPDELLPSQTPLHAPILVPIIVRP